MASAVEQLTSGYSGSEPVSYYDYYNAYGRDHYGDSWNDADPNSLGGRFQNWFKGTGNSAKQSYENYLSAFQYQKELEAKEAENRWTAMREDSQVQRAVEDIKKAGLNPWLALNGGSMSSAMAASQSASARYKVREQQLKSDAKKSNLLGTAMKILAMAIIMG